MTNSTSNRLPNYQTNRPQDQKTTRPVNIKHSQKTNRPTDQQTKRPKDQKTNRPLTLLLLLLLTACTPEHFPPPQIGFYHWQHTLNFDSLNHCLLDKLSSQELHVKVMDIGWQNGRPVPLSKLDIGSVDTSANIIPVIFITNEVWRNIGSTAIGELAQNVVNGTKHILHSASTSLPAPDHRIEGTDFKVAISKSKASSFLTPSEWQIDCDWTASTKDTYFQFLSEVRALLAKEVKLSATIRLHQFLNQTTQGIPPVDLGVLMAYNVGELDNPAAVNTILDTLITATYLRPGTNYPLPLDIALPYYQWGRIYRNNELVYLSNELSSAELTDTARFVLNNNGSYTVLRPTYLRGYALYSDDLIRLEGSEATALRALARQLKIIPGYSGQRLLFYHIGSQQGQVCDDLLLQELAEIIGNR